MNKQLCALCSIRKPKRECRLHGDICDSCCGETRSKKCVCCEYYKPSEPELPFYKCAVVSCLGMHSVFIARENKDNSLALALFLVDTANEGIKEADIKRNISKAQLENMLNRAVNFGHKPEEISIVQAKEIIKAGAQLSEQEGNTPDNFKQCIEIIGGLEGVQINEALIEKLNTLEWEEDESEKESKKRVGMMEPFHIRLPEAAERETRSFIVPKGNALPEGEYLLMESYCNDKNCDCRRVFINIFHNEKVLATIGFGWEDMAFYQKWAHGDKDIALNMKGSFLELSGFRSKYSETLLEFFKVVIMKDNAYVPEFPLFFGHYT